MSVCVNFQYFAILCCNSEVSPSSHFGWNPQIFCNIAIVLTLKYWLPPILDRTPQFFCNILVVTVKYWLPPILDGTPQFFCYIIVVTVKYWLPPILDGTPQIFCNILVVVIVKYWLPPIWDGTPQIFCYSIVVTVKYWFPPILDGTPPIFCYIIVVTVKCWLPSTQSVSDKGSSRPAPMGLANMQKNKYADIIINWRRLMMWSLFNAQCMRDLNWILR